MRVLLIEDETDLATRIHKGLTAAGFTVDHASDGDTGWYMGANQAFDAAVLDVGLPRLSGLEVLKRWRKAGRTIPVLLLTARSGWAERVAGLNAGADDYLEKPFHMEEVVARLRALTRRSAGTASPVLRHGDLELDTTTGSVSRDGRPVELTAQEFKILSYLLHRPRRIVSQDELLDHVYSYDEPRQSNTVEVYVARLRKKLGHESIRTVRGLGYRLGPGEHAAQ
ncbi:response regulator transcription factor [Reyranella sp.]|uniref:response regulator transcription factor n=1 Tax=Reyranella sp. TaxID=1929291 RepID=UPI003D1475CE